MIGLGHQSLGQKEEGTLFADALGLAKKHSMLQLQGHALGGLQAIARREGNFQQVQSICEDRLRVYTTAGDKKCEAASSMELAGLYMKNGQSLQECEELFNRAIKIFTDLGDERNLADCYEGLGVLYQLRNEQILMKSFFRKATEIRRRLGIIIDPWFVENGY